MASLRIPTALFSLLTLLPAAILAWQGWRATEPLIAELQRAARDLAERSATDLAVRLPDLAASDLARSREQLARAAVELREHLPEDGGALTLARLPCDGALILRTATRALLPAGPERLALQHLPEGATFNLWRQQIALHKHDNNLRAQAHAFVAPSLRANALALVLQDEPERAAMALRDIPWWALAAGGPLPCEVLCRSQTGRTQLAEGLAAGWLDRVPATERARAAWLQAAGADAATLARQQLRAQHEAGTAMLVSSVSVIPGVELLLLRPPATVLCALATQETREPLCVSDLALAKVAMPLRFTGPATVSVAVDTVFGPIAVTSTHTGHAALQRQATEQRWLTGLGLAFLLVLLASGLALVRRTLLREQRARAVRDDFIANVSHELKTPLTSLRLHTDMLAGDTLTAQERARYAAVAIAEGARLSALVDDLLDFAALERGQRRLEPEPVDLERAVRAMVETWQPLALRDDVELAASAKQEALGLADPTALTRILGNLLQNAFRHGRPARDGGRSRFHLHATPGCIAVRDNGPGVAAKDRERIFGRFERAGRSDNGVGSGVGSGVGLGLALSRELARAQGGDLSCTEEHGDTVFRLHLPLLPQIDDA